jgi:hypothetical protein
VDSDEGDYDKNQISQYKVDYPMEF